MVKFLDSTVNRWKLDAEQYLQRHKLTPSMITTGREAWMVAHHAGITEEAYRNRLVTDGHVQTALQKIFPNAVFKDKKVY